MSELFRNLFDLNHDGELDGFEKAAEFAVFASAMGKMDELDSKDEVEYELEAAGLDATELEFMDEDERREKIEDAGLDPDEYDF